MYRKLSIGALICALSLFATLMQANAQIIHSKLFLKKLDSGNYSTAYKLAAGGGIAGSSELVTKSFSAPPPNYETAVRWINDAAAPQDLFGATMILPGPDYAMGGPGVGFGINDSLQTVGSYAYQVIGGIDTFFGYRPFWSDGTFTTDLMVLDMDTDGGANAISNPAIPLDPLSSQVAGYSYGIDPTGNIFQTAARWNHLNDPANPLDLIPDPLDGFGGGNDAAMAIAPDGVTAGSVVDFGDPTTPYATYWEPAPSTAQMSNWAAFDRSEAFSIVKTEKGDYILAGYMYDTDHTPNAEKAALWINPGNQGAGKNNVTSFGDVILAGGPTSNDPDAHVFLLPLPAGAVAARAFDVYYDNYNGEIYVVGEAYDKNGVPAAFAWVSSDPTQSRLVNEFIHDNHSYDSATSINKVGGVVEFVGRATNLDPNYDGPDKTKAFVATKDPVLKLTLSAGAVTPPATVTGTVTLSNVPDNATYTIQLTKDHPNVSIPTSALISVPIGAHSGSVRFRASISALGAGSAPVGHVVALMKGGNTGDANYPFMRQRVATEVNVAGWLKSLDVKPSTLRPGQSGVVTVTLNKPAPVSGLSVPVALSTDVTNLLSMTMSGSSTGGGMSGTLFVAPGTTTATFSLDALTNQGNITPNTPLGNDTSQKGYQLSAAYGSVETLKATGVVKRWLDKVQIIGPDGAPTNVLSAGLAYKVRVILKANATRAQDITLTNDQPGLFPFNPVPPGPGTENMTIGVGAGSGDTAAFTVKTPTVPSTTMNVTAKDNEDGNVETVTVDIRPLVKSFTIVPGVIHTGDTAVATLSLNSAVTTTPTVTSSDPTNLTPGTPTSTDGGLTWIIPLTHKDPITVSENVRVIATVNGQEAEAQANLRPWIASSPISGPVTFTGFKVPDGRQVDFGSPNSADVASTVTVTLNDAPAGDVTVALTAADARVHITPVTSVTPNGTNTVSFRLTADEAVGGSINSALTATVTKAGKSDTYTTDGAAVTVRPWLTSMTPIAASVRRGTSTTLTVGLTGKVPSLVFVSGLGTNTTIPIAMASSNGSAGSVSPASLVFNSGDISNTATVSVLATTRARSFVVTASRSGVAKQTTISIR